MAQVVRHRPFTTDNRVRSRASSCEICGRQNDTWTGRLNTWMSPVSTIPTVPHTHLHRHAILTGRTN